MRDREESDISMVAAKSEREEAEVAASPVASRNMDAVAGAESSPPRAASSQDNIDGRREASGGARARVKSRPLAPRNHDK